MNRTTHFIKSVISLYVQLMVDMLYSFVAIIRYVDDLTVDSEIDNIDVVKILLYVACERCVFQYTANDYNYDTTYTCVDCCAVVIPVISYLVTIISFLHI